MAEAWGYESFHAIAKGAVKPRATPYIILFITREKQELQTQYEDHLENGVLEIEGETNHAADNRMINAQRTTNKIEKASRAAMMRIRAHLVRSNQAAIDRFFNALNKRLGRHVTRVVVIPLYGRINEFSSIEDAVRFLEHHTVYEGSGEFRKYEIRIEFSNADKVEAFIEAKDKVKEFLAFVAGQ